MAAKRGQTPGSPIHEGTVRIRTGGLAVWDITSAVSFHPEESWIAAASRRSMAGDRFLASWSFPMNSGSWECLPCNLHQPFGTSRARVRLDTRST